MPSDHLSVPPFESKLPDGLLRGLDDKERYLYTKLDEIGMAQTWLSTQAVRQAGMLAELKDELSEVKVQTIKTNGRTTSNEAELAALRPDIDTVRFAKKVVCSRYFWMGTAAFLLIGVPFLAAHAPGAAAFYTILTSWFGL